MVVEREGERLEYAQSFQWDNSIHLLQLNFKRKWFFRIRKQNNEMSSHNLCHFYFLKADAKTFSDLSIFKLELIITAIAVKVVMNNKCDCSC
jgi:hypothetical protein